MFLLKFCWLSKWLINSWSRASRHGKLARSRPAPSMGRWGIGEWDPVENEAWLATTRSKKLSIKYTVYSCSYKYYSFLITSLEERVDIFRSVSFSSWRKCAQLDTNLHAKVHFNTFNSRIVGEVTDFLFHWIEWLRFWTKLQKTKSAGKTKNLSLAWAKLWPLRSCCMG